VTDWHHRTTAGSEFQMEGAAAECTLGSTSPRSGRDEQLRLGITAVLNLSIYIHKGIFLFTVYSCVSDLRRETAVI